MNIPTEGATGGWVLASDSDVQHLTAAPGGTLYAYVKGLTYTLYKSTDGGLKWSYIGNVQDPITGIAVSPSGAKTIYYSTASSVYKSSNSGKSFIPLPDIPLATDEYITSLTVTQLSKDIVAVGTANPNALAYGRVDILDESEIFPDWTDTKIGNYDVYGLGFAPNYNINRQLTAVTSNEIDTFIFSKFGNADWNAFMSPTVLDKDNASVHCSVNANGAVIAFPNDYVSMLEDMFYVGIKTGDDKGDVYKVNCFGDPVSMAATDLNCGSAYGINNIDISGLTIYKEGQSTVLLTGAANSAQICISINGGLTWLKNKKPPTGDSDTEVILSSDFIASGIIYAVTSGDNSALSISRDAGFTWNQISLVDNVINNIVDFIPSPITSNDQALFMITTGVGQSLWRSTNNGINWERLLATGSSGLNGLTLVNLPLQYSADCQTIYVAGIDNGSSVVWVSKDNGQNFQRRPTYDPATGVNFTLDVWAIQDENTFIVGSFDGSEGVIYRTTDGGYSYSQSTPVGTCSLCSLALSPHYNDDGMILVGNTGGWVYWSNDSGASFQPLPADTSASPLNGEIAVAFDADFNTNHTVYAASSSADSGIYRFVIGSSTDWERIDDTLPTGAEIKQLSSSTPGALYAANAHHDGGMERCINPVAKSGVTFESVSNGLSSGAVLTGLWQRAHQIWSLDNHDISEVKLMTFYDTLVTPPIQTTPENTTSGIGTLVDHSVRNITIDWETIDGASSYEWQCSYNNDFSTIPTDLSGTTGASSVHLPLLEPATTYYWRVRVHTPLLSPWSLKYSFTTCMDTAEVNLKPEVPVPGATGVSIKPVFQWTAVFGAEAYELLVAADADFTHPVIVKIAEYAMKTNAWNCDISLNYNTVYYWKIRATTSSTSSAWSSVGIFTTEGVLIPISPTLTPTMTELLSQRLLNIQQPITTTVIASSLPSVPVPSTMVALFPEIPAWLLYLFAGLFTIVLLALLIVLVIVIKIKS